MASFIKKAKKLFKAGAEKLYKGVTPPLPLVGEAGIKQVPLLGDAVSAVETGIGVGKVVGSTIKQPKIPVPPSEPTLLDQAVTGEIPAATPPAGGVSVEAPPEEDVAPVAAGRHLNFVDLPPSGAGGGVRIETIDDVTGEIISAVTLNEKQYKEYLDLVQFPSHGLRADPEDPDAAVGISNDPEIARALEESRSVRTFAPPPVPLTETEQLETGRTILGDAIKEGIWPAIAIALTTLVSSYGALKTAEIIAKTPIPLKWKIAVSATLAVITAGSIFYSKYTANHKEEVKNIKGAWQGLASSPSIYASNARDGTWTPAEVQMHSENLRADVDRVESRLKEAVENKSLGAAVADGDRYLEKFYLWKVHYFEPYMDKVSAAAAGRIPFSSIEAPPLPDGYFEE